MLDQHRVDPDSASSDSTVHLAIQGLHNTFYRFRRQQQRMQQILVTILVLLCISSLLQMCFLIYLAIHLRAYES